MSLQKIYENFIVIVRKWEMLAVTKVKMSISEKDVNKNRYNLEVFGSIRLLSCKRIAKNWHHLEN